MEQTLKKYLETNYEEQNWILQTLKVKIKLLASSFKQTLWMTVAEDHIRQI